MLQDNPYRGQTVKLLTPEKLQGFEAEVIGVRSPHRSLGGYYDDPEPPTPLDQYSVELELPDGDTLSVSVRDVVELDPRLHAIERLISKAINLRSKILYDKKEKIYFLNREGLATKLKSYDNAQEDALEEIDSITKNSPEFMRAAKKMVNAAERLREQFCTFEGKRSTQYYLREKAKPAIRAFDRTATITGYKDFGKSDRAL